MAEVLVPIFRVKDGEKTAPWYARLGFEVAGRHRFTPKLPLYMFLERGDVRLHLSEHKGDAPKKSVAYFYVDNLDEIGVEFEIDIGERPWGREIVLTDPDGNSLRIGESKS